MTAKIPQLKPNTKEIKPHFGGRKKRYTDKEQLQAKIDEYFKTVEVTDKQPTLTGLSLHLGFVDTATLRDYLQTPQFGIIVKRARARIIENVENRLINGKPPIGLIFWLKNNAGWADKQELDMTSGGMTLAIVQLPVRNSHK